MPELVPVPGIPKAAASKLGFYVYLYVNPIDGKIFYVGKGKNGRALAHLRTEERKAIAKIIRRIRSEGSQPQIEILAHGLGTPEMALKVEAAAIDILGVKNLANLVRGHGVAYGRRPWKEVVAHYTKKRAIIREPAVLIRINKLYRYGMSAVELYDATRSAWKLGARRAQARYALAVYEGVVREVYRITGWFPAVSTFNVGHDGRIRRRPGRCEFVGTLAEPDVRGRYINRYVGHLFTKGSRNPISYVNTPPAG